MIADYEFKFSQHRETVRRAEANARLIAALTPERSPGSGDRPRKLAALLRRIAGSPATA